MVISQLLDTMFKR